MEQRLRESPDGQVSLTDPDSRSMATSGRGTGMVGYNVQTAVDDTHHLIVTHEVTNIGNDRGQLTNMPGQARAATGIKELTVVADRGYFISEEVLQFHEAGITTFVPKPLTSGKHADGYFGKQDFICKWNRTVRASAGFSFQGWMWAWAPSESSGGSTPFGIGSL